MPAPVAAAAPKKADLPPPKPSDLPPVGGSLPALGGGGFGLGSVGGRAGRFEFDAEAKKRAAAELSKLNAEFDAAQGEEEKAEDGQSLQDLMKAKRMKTEKFLEEEKGK